MSIRLLVNVVGDAKGEQSKLLLDRLTLPHRCSYDLLTHVTDVCILHKLVSVSNLQFVIYADSLGETFAKRTQSCSFSEWAKDTDIYREQIVQGHQRRIKSLIQTWLYEDCIGIQHTVIERLRKQLCLAEQESKDLVKDPAHRLNVFAEQWTCSKALEYSRIAVPFYIVIPKHRHDQKRSLQQILHPFLVHKQQLHFLDAIDASLLSYSACFKSTVPMQLSLTLDSSALSKWMSHVQLWKTIAAGTEIIVGGEDGWIVGPTFDRDLQMSLRLAHKSGDEPLCLWIGTHLPIETRIVPLMSTSTRTFRSLTITTTDSHKGYIQKGIFAFIMNPSFARHLVNCFEAAKAGSLNVNVDEWLFQQLPDHQWSMQSPIVYTESTTHKGAALALAKLSPYNKILQLDS